MLRGSSQEPTAICSANNLSWQRPGQCHNSKHIKTYIYRSEFGDTLNESLSIAGG